MFRILPSLVAIAFASRVFASTPEGGAVLPDYAVADASAPVVDEANLLASERFWPYQAALVRATQLPGAANALPGGSLGVVIRVEPGARVRIDFGRDGLATLPVSATDLVARANAIRRGDARKQAPNLTFAIAPRLLDAESVTLRRVLLEDSFERTGFLCVFANPDSPSFPKLARLLAPLANRGGVLPVLFGEGEHPDAELLPQLRAAGWRGAFALDHLAEAYARTLVDGESRAPRAALFSAEGREIWSGEVAGALPAGLERAWAEAFRQAP